LEQEKPTTPAESDRLRRRLERVEEQVARKDERISELEKEIERLKREIAELKLNSTNSSKPPSSDGLAGPQRARCRKRVNPSKRKPGGQPGHPGRYRKPVAAERVSETVLLLPDRCGGCGAGLPEDVRQNRRVGEPRRHQVVELPPIEAHVIEYQCLKVRCPDCGVETRAELPEEARPQTGPRLTALIAYLTVGCRMPRRVAQRMLEQALGIQISLGCVQTCWEQVSEAVKEPYGELERSLDSQAVLNVDETGWRQNGEKRWIWALVAQTFTFYVVAAQRSAAVLESLLGAAFSGILCSDRLPTYLKYHEGKAQLCWAHLKRNFLEILEQDGDWRAQRFARDALAQYAKLFRLWWKFRSGKADRQQLIQRSLRIRRAFLNLAKQWWDCDNRKVANLANAIGANFERLFSFLDEEGVEPTNNAAERALRTAVQWRKTSFGNRSDAGAIATARLLTVAQSCAQQNRSTLHFLTEAVRLKRLNRKVPSLIQGPRG
jgi:transposase